MQIPLLYIWYFSFIIGINSNIICIKIIILCSSDKNTFDSIKVVRRTALRVYKLIKPFNKQYCECVYLIYLKFKLNN